MYFIIEHAQIGVEKSCLFVGYIFIYINENKHKNENNKK